MAQKNNILNNLLSSSPSFYSQMLFGFLIVLISNVAGAPITLSFFLGILGGFILNWITTATENSPKPPTVASSDGIDAGLRYWLFFMFGFVLLGYPAPMSIVLGAIAALGGGWMIAWWNSKEETKTQLPVEKLEELASQQVGERTITKRQIRRPSRRYRRTSGSFNFRFWERK